MSKRVEIRPSAAADMAAIERLYGEAFPDENLLPLVHELLGAAADVLSLVALRDGSLLGHVAFTRCQVVGCDAAPAVLGPLAVAPGAQRQGVGSGLVREGLERLGKRGVDVVYVLGSPRYYARFGFGMDERVVPPYPLPAHWRTAWQSVRLRIDAAPCQGRLSVPTPWRRPTLWAP